MRDMTIYNRMNRPTGGNGRKGRERPLYEAKEGAGGSPEELKEERGGPETPQPQPAGEDEGEGPRIPPGELPREWAAVPKGRGERYTQSRRSSRGTALLVGGAALCLCAGLGLWALLGSGGARPPEKTPEELLAAGVTYSPGPDALPRATGGDGATALPVQTTPQPTTAQTPEGMPQATAPPLDAGDWGDKFAGKFAQGETERTENSYRSRDISVTVEKVQEEGVTYFVADIYIRNLENFRTAFSGGEYGGSKQATLDMAVENGAVVALSGDYYAAHSSGLVIRNGELYRDTEYGDVCALYQDGVLETYEQDKADIPAIVERGAWQAWTFGPKLLTDGRPMEKFNSNVNPANPRSAIGYYEPGHYCFVLVDGRQQGYSKGMTLKELSQLFYDLGCVDAYNLDGGQTAVMAFDGKLASHPYEGGRKTSDILYIAETEGENP